VFFSGLGQVEGVFKLTACQQSCVRGDGRTLKLQAYLGVKANREVCVFAFTDEVFLSSLRNQKQST